MADIEKPKEPARKRAERKWANNDLVRRYKDLKKNHAKEMEPRKTTVVTVENPYFEEQLMLHEIVVRTRKKFIRQLKGLVSEGREQGIKKYRLSLDSQKRRLLGAKLKILMAREKQKQDMEQFKTGEVSRAYVDSLIQQG
jgi:hypothetical protein